MHFHIGLAEATGSPALVAAMTEAQGAMTDLISHIAHPPEVLAWSNAQHARLVDCLERATRRSRCGSWPTTCAAPSTCSRACCLDGADTLPAKDGGAYLYRRSA